MGCVVPYDMGRGVDMGFLLFGSLRLIWVVYGLRRAIYKKHKLFNKK